MVGNQILAHGRVLDKTEPYEPQSARAAHTAVDLYSGPLGLALFWAALGRVFPENQRLHVERSFQALQTTRQQIAEWLAEPRRLDDVGVGLGGVCGLGAVIYTLTCSAELLDEPALLAEAVAVSKLITPERIARDRRFDLTHGSAGAILALLALESALVARHGEQIEEHLSGISLCAEHLLARRTADRGGPRAWAVDGRLCCGFAHGAAGILYALLRAYERIGNPSLLDAACEAMAFERRLFRPHHGTWPPFPGFAEFDRPMIAWCWGASGIALGRIAALGIIDEPAVREEIRAGIESARRLRQTLEDHLCCGNLGRAEILAYASRSLAQTGIVEEPGELLTAAHRLVVNVLRRAKGRGDFGWSANRQDGTFQPFFFKGAAGVGFALLHLASPETLPFPLLLETQYQARRSP